MVMRMPRGAIPSPRSELAASQPYRPEGGAEVFVPSGAFPSPNHELADASPYRATVAAPESFITWPEAAGAWADVEPSDSRWVEEAFAKACAQPPVSIPTEALVFASRQCASSNFAEFLQTRGFEMDGVAYLDGPFHSVDWTNPAALNGAIANVGPVKIGFASAGLASGRNSRIPCGTSGWAVHDLPTLQPGDDCASLCGYGTLAALADLFLRRGVDVDLPPGMPVGLCYAMFTRGSIGIIDRQSLVNITGEAWVRVPTTTVKAFGG